MELQFGSGYGVAVVHIQFIDVIYGSLVNVSLLVVLKLHLLVELH